MARRHSDFIKFATVGGITWVVDTAVFVMLTGTILAAKPVTAKIIAVLTAMMLSYLLSRGWSFRPHRGLPEVRQAFRFFAVSLLAVALYAAPLWISRYLLDLRAPAVSLLTQHVADFVSGQIVGVLVGMAFRWWGFRRFVFPGGIDHIPRVTQATGVIMHAGARAVPNVAQINRSQPSDSESRPENMSLPVTVLPGDRR